MEVHMYCICTHLGTALGAVCLFEPIRMDGSVKGYDFY